MVLETPLTSIAYQEWGDPNGKPILCLHGWLDNSNSFLPLSKYLVRDLPEKIRLVAMDFPGHGHSGHRPEKMLYAFVDFLADIASFADSMNWEKFSILGHSMGGGLGSLFAGAFPERIEKLMLIEALGPVTREASDAPENLAKAIRRFLDHTGKVDSSQFRDIDQLVRLRMRAGELAEESARLLMERGIEELNSGVKLRRDSRLNLPSLMRLTENQVLEFLKRITAPSLLIWGKQGFKWESNYLGARTTAVSNLTQINLEGYHHLHMDHPELVSKAIADWWK
ncbi:MAG: alpha/beta hydrolase [Leptospira sp.]|nr:alpha/beta hydrolase [Leptospira sp.]